MIYTMQVTAKSQGNLVFDLFVYDSRNGYTAKDVCETPGAFDEVASQGLVTLHFAELGDVTVGEKKLYKASVFGLISVRQEGLDENKFYDNVMDVTRLAASFVSMPETALNAVLESMSSGENSAEGRAEEVEVDIIRASVDSLHYYESLTRNKTVCLPEIAWDYAEPELKAAMMSKRRVYALKGKDNVAIFQKAYNEEFCLELPEVEDIHQSSNILSPVSLLRVQMPYRQEVAGGRHWGYAAIYHTPYYLIDPVINRTVPASLKWIDGYCRNDELPIQDYEKKMYNNLLTLIKVDISRYVCEMVTSIVDTTAFGDGLRRLAASKDVDAMTAAHNEIIAMNSDKLQLDMKFDDIQTLAENGFDRGMLADFISNHLKVKTEYLEELILGFRYVRALNCERLSYIIKLDDDAKDHLTQLLIDNGFMTNAMFDFIRVLCSDAYTVHWGHTGVTKAIYKLIDQESISGVSELYGKWVDYKMVKGARFSPEEFKEAFLTADSDYDGSADDSFDGSGADADESTSNFDYYLAPETVRSIMQTKVGMNLFGDSPAMSRNVAIVERWRKDNGDATLCVFLGNVYAATNSPAVLVECFIKLARWGDNKPRVLVVNDERVKEVFEMSLGKKSLNTDNVDDSMLVRKDGCAYSLKGLVYSTDKVVPGIAKPVVAFHLEQDYDRVQKSVLASWCDLAEMVESGNIDIAELKTGSCPSTVLSNLVNITTFNQVRHNLYVSESMISESLDRHMRAEELSALALLETQGIFDSKDYYKSMRVDEIITAKDLKFKNLHMYSDALGKLYMKHGMALQQISDMYQLQDLITKFGGIWKQVRDGYEKKPAEEGTSKAEAGLMNLFGDKHRKKKVNYTTEPLDKKFWIIYDRLRTSNIMPMTFTDGGMTKLSAAVGNCIVLLLMDAGDHVVICRDNVKSGQIVVSNGKFKLFSYDKFKGAIEGLLAGKDVNMNGRPMRLHESVRNFLE